MTRAIPRLNLVLASAFIVASALLAGCSAPSSQSSTTETTETTATQPAPMPEPTPAPTNYRR
jgi:uncharacterized lipoprotein YajG